MRGFFWFGILVALVAAPQAFAQGTAEQRERCRGDAQRFCDAQIPDAIAVEGCLRQHVSQLSPGCRAEFGGGGVKKRHPRRRRHYY